MELKDLLQTAFNAGKNAGIVEAGHQLELMGGVKEETFDEFCDLAFIKFMLLNFTLNRIKELTPYTNENRNQEAD